MNRKIVLLFILVFTVLLLSACGGDGTSQGSFATMSGYSEPASQEYVAQQQMAAMQQAQSEPTGREILDGVLTEQNATISDLQKNALAARLQQMIDAGTDSNLQIALVLAADPQIRDSVSGSNAALTLANVVGEVKVGLENDVELSTGIELINSKAMFTNNEDGSTIRHYLDFINPTDISSVGADIAVLENSTDIATESRIRGTFYNDGTGDIYALIRMRNGEIQYGVYRCLDSGCMATENINEQSRGTLGSYSLGESYSCKVSYNGNSQFTFTLNGISTSIDFSTDAPHLFPPSNTFKGIGIKDGRIRASFDNVVVDDSLYDDFSSGVIDGSKWFINIVNPSGVTTTHTVTSLTGRVWMDRNLGASRVATAYNDSAAYGDRYQWGRGTDGHEERTSPTTTTLSSSDNPGHGDFIVAPNSPYDWRSPQKDELWQGVSGVNNPCPSGFRLPTSTEWQDELTKLSITDRASAFASPLKLVSAGMRSGYNYGASDYAGSYGYYWSSSVDGRLALSLNFNSGDVYTYSYIRTHGFSVRCLED